MRSNRQESGTKSATKLLSKRAQPLQSLHTFSEKQNSAKPTKIPFTFPLPFASTALPAFGTTEACAGAAAAGAGAAGAGTALVGSASGAAAEGGGEVLRAAGGSFRFAEPLPQRGQLLRKS